MASTEKSKSGFSVRLHDLQDEFEERKSSQKSLKQPTFQPCEKSQSEQADRSNLSPTSNPEDSDNVVIFRPKSLTDNVRSVHPTLLKRHSDVTDDSILASHESLSSRISVQSEPAGHHGADHRQSRGMSTSSSDHEGSLIGRLADRHPAGMERLSKALDEGKDLFKKAKEKVEKVKHHHQIEKRRKKEGNKVLSLGVHAESESSDQEDLESVASMQSEQSTGTVTTPIRAHHEDFADRQPENPLSSSSFMQQQRVSFKKGTGSIAVHDQQENDQGAKVRYRGTVKPGETRGQNVEDGTPVDGSVLQDGKEKPGSLKHQASETQRKGEPDAPDSGNLRGKFSCRNAYWAVGVLLVLITWSGWFPGFLMGLLWGIFLSALAGVVLFWLFVPTTDNWSTRRKSRELVDLVKVSQEELEKEDKIVYKGWMNEFPGHYSPTTYQINNARSVLVRLDGAILRLSTPRQNVFRHTCWDDPTLRNPNPTFVTQKLYNLGGTEIVLRPRNLAKRRWWSRKYPICLRLKEGSEMTLSEAKNIGGSTESVWSSGEESLSGSRKVGVPSPDKEDGKLEIFINDQDAELFEDNELAEDEASEAEEAEEFTLAEIEAANRSKKKKKKELPPSASNSDITKESAKVAKRIRPRRRKLLYLFARSSREKEHWFHRLRQAACQQTFRELARRRPVSEGDNSENELELLGVETSHQILETSASVPILEDVDEVVKAQQDSRTLEKEKSLSSLKEVKKKEKEVRRPDLWSWEKLDITEEISKNPMANEWVLYSSVHKEFEWYMKHVIRKSENESESSDKGGVKCMDLGISKPVIMKGPAQCPSTIKQQQLAWVNAFASRIFYDFSRDRDWINTVRDRIQRKLSTIRLPYFIETLSLSQLAPGLVTPKILSVDEPSLNEWGLWVDLEVQYSGGIQLVLETKINLMKLKSGSLAVNTQSPAPSPRDTRVDSPPIDTVNSAPAELEAPKKDVRNAFYSRYSDSDVPESPESSPDEDQSLINNLPFNKTTESAPVKESAGKKILNLVEKVSQSQFFQDATENKYVKKAMQTISETPLILTVEVLYMEGTMALNIPLPPSDRLWYAFRCPPVLTLRAQPRVGEKVLGMTQITDWIQNRLRLLLEKNLVLPNMDDISVPVMSGNKMFTQFNK